MPHSAVPDSAFRLRWSRTWSDVSDDYTARKDDAFCRVYHEAGGPQSGRWFWTCCRTTQLGSGYAGTVREAALNAETALLSGRPRKRKGGP